MSEKLKGIFTPTLVPLDARGEINEQELRRFISWLIEKGAQVSHSVLWERYPLFPHDAPEISVNDRRQVDRHEVRAVTVRDSIIAGGSIKTDTIGKTVQVLEDGTLEIDLPPDASKVHVELFREEPDDEEESSGGEASDGNGGNDESDGADQGGEQKPFESYDFNLGELDPATEISGIQARLLNLGLYNGEINGTLDDDTREAISHFRWIELRDRKEDIDAIFLKALRKAHGS